MFRPKPPLQHRLFAWLSILCPIIAIRLVWFTGSDHSCFWSAVNKDSTDDINRHAGAMMAATEGIRLLFSVFFAGIIGIFFAAMSLVLKRTKLGFFSLTFNLLLLLSST